jgi:hypothetical protein
MIKLSLVGGAVPLVLRAMGSSPAASAPGAPSPGPNVIVNASFEDGVEGRTAPGWTFA